MTTTESTTEAADAAWADPAWQVDSATRTCCGGIGGHAGNCARPAALAPAGCSAASWDRIDGGSPRCRDIFGADRTVTDHTIVVYPWATQSEYGNVETGAVEIADNDQQLLVLNSDQARELAAHLLELAAQIDGWVSR